MRLKRLAGSTVSRVLNSRSGNKNSAQGHWTARASLQARD